MMANLYLRGNPMGGLPSFDPLSLNMYCHLKQAGKEFNTLYTPEVPYLETPNGNVTVNQNNPLDLSTKMMTLMDNEASQHYDFEIFVGRVMPVLKNLEWLTYFYLSERYHVVKQWARDRAEHLLDKSEQEILEMLRDTCKELSEILRDNTYLFRVMIEEGKGPFDLFERSKAISPGIRHRKVKTLDYNPVTSLDAMLTSISIIIIKLLEGQPIHREFSKHLNLSTYAERFFVKFERRPDARDLNQIEGGCNYVHQLVQGSVFLGRGGTGHVYRCEFPPDNPLGVPQITCAVKVFKDVDNYFGEQYYLDQLSYEGFPKLIAYGSAKEAYLIMKLFVNGDLKGRINDLTHGEALDMLIHVSDALHRMHSHFNGNRIVHSDLKPENVLIDEEGRASICDLASTHVTGEKLGTPTKDFHPKFGTNTECETKFIRYTQALDNFSLGYLIVQLITTESGAGFGINERVEEKMRADDTLRGMMRAQIRNSGCTCERARRLLNVALQCMAKRKKDRICPYEASFALREIRDMPM